jgi:hypothetical protein
MTPTSTWPQPSDTEPKISARKIINMESRKQVLSGKTNDFAHKGFDIKCTKFQARISGFDVKADSLYIKSNTIDSFLFKLRAIKNF